MVTRTFILLVRRVVFLVDDDQSEILQRRKDRAARPDDNARLPVAHAVPLVMAFPLAQMTVQHGHIDAARGKARGKPLHRLRRQCNFRHEHKRRFPRVDHLGDSAQIHFRLPASRDAFEHDRFMRGRITQRRTNPLQRALLLGTQLGRFRGHKLFGPSRGTAHLFARDRDQPAPLQRFQRRVGRARLRGQLRDRQWTVRFLQTFHRRRLTGRLAAKGLQFLRTHLAGQHRELPLERRMSGLAHRPRQNAAQRILLVAPVVVRHPLGEFHQHRCHLRTLVHHRRNRPHSFGRGCFRNGNHRPDELPVTQWHAHAGTGCDAILPGFGNFVVEFLARRAVENHLGKARHGESLSGRSNLSIRH